MSTSADPDSLPPDASGTNVAAGDAPPDANASAAEIEADIERTREQFGETIEALTHKFDMKSRARDTMSNLTRRATGRGGRDRAFGGGSFARAREAATDDQGQARPAVPIGAAAVTAVLLVAGNQWWERRR